MLLIMVLDFKKIKKTDLCSDLELQNEIDQSLFPELIENKEIFKSDLDKIKFRFRLTSKKCVTQ